MTVEFKSEVSSGNVNDAFISKKVDSTTVGVVSLNAPASGAVVINTQQSINDNQDLSETNETDISNHVNSLFAHDSGSIVYNNGGSGLTAVNVKQGLDELDADLNTHETLAVGAHAATAVSYDNTVSGLSAIEVKSAIDEIAASGIAALNDIGDVNTPAPNDLEVLTYDNGNSEWISAPAAGGSIALNDISDVVAPTPSDQDVLTFDTGSGDWINAPSAAPVEVSMGYERITNSPTENATFIFADLLFDTHSAYSAGEYTIPIAGRYRVSTKVRRNAVGVSRIVIYLNNVKYGRGYESSTALDGICAVTTVIDCAVNDVIKIGQDVTVGAFTTNGTGIDNQFFLEKIN